MTLHRAFDLRQQGDYLASVQITKKVAEEIIEKIEGQIEKAKEILSGTA